MKKLIHHHIAALPSNKRQGSALIVALLIMALVAIVAVSISMQEQAQIERTRLVLDNDKMYLYAKAVENWAMIQLNKDLTQNADVQDLSKISIDSLPLQFTDIHTNDGFTISGKLDDLQGKFNLNNLVDANNEQNFVNLLLAVDPNLDADKAKKIAQATHAWVSKTKESDDGNDTIAADTQQLNQYYLHRHPPYQASQNLMASASELRLVKGINANLYLRLKPFITALPKTTPINVNTVSAPALTSLSSVIDLPTAQQIISSRGDMPFESLNDFLDNSTIQEANIKKDAVTLNSEYFLVTATVTNGSENTTIRAMLYRPMPTKNTQNTQDGTTDKQEPAVSVLWESRGGI